MHRFGFDAVLDFVADVEIYQARVSPELWRARPTFEKGAHKWEAGSAAALMALIESDFETTIKPFRPWRNAEAAPVPETADLWPPTGAKPTVH
jgi:hypothetical protein